MAKIRRGNRRYYFYFISVVILLIVSGLSLFQVIKTTSLLNLKTIEVSGVYSRLNSDIYEYLEPNIDKNLYDIDTESLRDSVACKFPILRNVDVSRSLPNKLKVKYNLETPFAVIRFLDGKNYYITKEKKLLEKVSFGYFRELLPIIVSKEQSTKYKLGNIVQDSTVVEMIGFLEQLNEIDLDFYKKIFCIYMEDNKVYFKDTIHENVIYFGEGNYEEKIDLFLNYVNSFIDGLYIDFSYKDQIITSKRR